MTRRIVLTAALGLAVTLAGCKPSPTTTAADLNNPPPKPGMPAGNGKAAPPAPPAVPK